MSDQPKSQLVPPFVVSIRVVSPPGAVLEVTEYRLRAEATSGRSGILRRQGRALLRKGAAAPSAG